MVLIDYKGYFQGQKGPKVFSKVAKSWEMWEKVEKSSEKWGKVVKSK